MLIGATDQTVINCKEFIAAKDLKIGDLLYTGCGYSSPVETIRFRGKYAYIKLAEMEKAERFIGNIAFIRGDVNDRRI